MDKDDNFVKVPTDLFMAIMTYGFTQVQLVVVLYVIRKTYGWRKHKDKISISAMARDLDKKRQLISRTVSDLQKMCVIDMERDRNGIAPVMWIQDPKNWDKPATVELHATTGFHATFLDETCNRTVSGGATVELQVTCNRTVAHNRYIYTDTLTTDKTTEMSPTPSQREENDDGVDPAELLKQLEEEKKNGAL